MTRDTRTYYTLEPLDIPGTPTERLIYLLAQMDQVIEDTRAGQERMRAELSRRRRLEMDQYGK